MAANPAPQLHPREELDQKHLQVVEKDPLDALLKEGTLSEANLTRCAAHAEVWHAVLRALSSHRVLNAACGCGRNYIESQSLSR